MKIPWAKPHFWGDEKKYILDALQSSWISGGPYVERLESEFSKFHEAAHCITTSNGTSALHLALLALGVGRGDEVIVPGFSFMAPANMAIGVGAKPVYADILEDTWCIDPSWVERKITKKTKAVIAVHNYGNVCDMKSLVSICRRRGISLIEDAAEALFSKYRGRYAGTFGDIGCFSFQATKSMTTGEGGCVVTGNSVIAGRMRRIRDHGLSKRGRYRHDAVGYNFRLTNLQAAMGCAQFKYRLKIQSARKKNDREYRRLLTLCPGIRFQSFRPEVQPVPWCTALAMDPSVFGMSRDSLMKRMFLRGIETRPGFYPPSKMPIYRAPALPVAERVSQNILSLPSSPSLKVSQIRFICKTLLKQIPQQHYV